MAFPSNPTNGQSTTQNGLVYTYNSTLTAWVLSTSTTGDISANAITALGNITTTGNITGNYLLGNGSQLTGISVSTDKIFNGTSNVFVVSSGGNVTVGVGGAGNVAVFSGTDITAAANIVPSANITYDLGTSTQRWRDLWLSNSTIYLGNATISANATSIIMTNPAGGQTVLAGASGNITGGNVTVTGAITADSVTTVSIPLVLDDISNQCDGAQMVFALKNNTSNITSANIADSKNLQVAVNGLILSPWVNIQNFIWYPLCFSGFPTGSPGYQVNTTASSANITFYRSPAQGSQVVLTIISKSSSAQVRNYPFTASYIALGV